MYRYLKNDINNYMVTTIIPNNATTNKIRDITNIYVK